MEIEDVIAVSSSSRETQRGNCANRELIVFVEPAKVVLPLMWLILSHRNAWCFV